MKSFVSKRFCYTFAVLLSILIFQNSVYGDNEEEDIKWDEASKEVDSLQFSQAYIDSIMISHDITPLYTPLRTTKRLLKHLNETLVYEISWGPFKAGYVVLSTDYNPKNKTIRLGAKALSSNFISAFYRMRDYIISTVCSEGLYPIVFEQHLREGRKFESDQWILYDHPEGKLYVKGRKKQKVVDAPMFTNDYLSALYQVRNMMMKVGDKYSIDIYLNSKVYPLSFKCPEKKKISVDAGTFNCILVEPKLVGEGKTFNSKDKLEVWLSDDEQRIPVLIKCKIKFGAIRGKLIHYSFS
ncbi:MAG: DUF3108 domain-containing protein [Fibrobacter sp.]|nr:DUF3108 domain-containing protein [Fibrobacter sp.]